MENSSSTQNGSMKGSSMKDSTVDAIAAVAIILLMVTTAVFWVSHQ